MSFANESGWDRVIRVVLGLALLYIGWAGVVSGGWGVFFKVFGFLPFVTGLVGFCPTYALLKVRTKAK